MREFESDRLQLPSSGDVVSLAIQGAGNRYEVTWLGFNFEQSVMVTAPRAGGNLVPIYVSDLIAIRYIKDNHIHGFRVPVLDYNRSPYPYLHLEYPKSIAEHRVRTAPRVTTHMQGRMVAGGSEEAVDVLDISDTGARIGADRDDLAEGAAFELHFDVEFAGSREDLTVPCIVKNVTPLKGADASTMSYGVAFGDMDRMDRIMLSGYIYEQLSKRRANI